MEKLKIKYLNLKKSIDTFKVSVDDFEKVKKGTLDDPNDYIRDAVIKRFEFTLDTTWKFLKEYLEKVIGATLENKGPKPVFRECLKAGLLNEQQTVLAIEMVDSRNMTSHIYKEEIANTISKDMYKYYNLIETIIGSINLQ